MAFSDSDNTRFCLVGLRQNVQGKGNADGSILKQDKAVVSPHFTPARSAGRKCRGQKTFGLFTVCFEKFDMISLSRA